MMLGRYTRTALLIGGTASAVTMLSAAPAAAQGSEVELLRRQVQDLLARIERLERPPAPTVTEQPVPTILSGNPKVRVTFGGWVNRAVIFADNGENSDFLFVDNNGASSRINVSAVGQVTERLSLGSVLELEAVSNNSRTQGLETNSTGLSFNERKIEVWAEVDDFGRLWLGQGDMAAQAIAEVDLSGTANLGLYSDLGATFGGLQFAAEAPGAPPLDTPTINATHPNYDGIGNSRDDRIRIDTTSIGGFVLSAAAAHNGNMDVALRYAGKLGTTSVAAAVGYADWSETGSPVLGDLIAGSFSVKLENGLNATVAAGQQDFRADARDEGRYWYAKLGYIAKLTTLGDTAFAIDYYDGSDTFVDGSESKAYGATIVQQLTAINSELYLGVRNHEFEAPAAEFDDVLAVLTGARVRF